MTYEPVEMWRARCDGDGCEARWPGPEREFFAWADRATVDETIWDTDWCTDKTVRPYQRYDSLTPMADRTVTRHWCPDHCPHCGECGTDGGPYGPDTDGLCNDCFGEDTA